MNASVNGSFPVGRSKDNRLLEVRGINRDDLLAGTLVPDFNLSRLDSDERSLGSC